MKKLAICLFGIHYFDSKKFWGHKGTYTIDWRESIENNNKNLFFYFKKMGYKIDFYFSTNLSNKKEELIKTFNPISYVFRSDYDDITRKKRYKQRNIKVIDVLKLLEYTNKEYDTILLTRFDLLYFKLIENIDLEKFNITSKLKKNLIDDNLYIFPFKHLKEFIKINEDNIEKSAHRLKNHILKINSINYLEKKLLEYSSDSSIYTIKRINYIIPNGVKNFVKPKELITNY